MKENGLKANLVSFLANFFVTEGIAKTRWFGKQGTSDPQLSTEDCDRRLCEPRSPQAGRTRHLSKQEVFYSAVPLHLSQSNRKHLWVREKNRQEKTPVIKSEDLNSTPFPRKPGKEKRDS